MTTMLILAHGWNLYLIIKLQFESLKPLIMQIKFKFRT